MITSVLEAKRHITFVEGSIPEPDEGEALVRMSYVGVCGSDLHRYNCDWPLVKPLTIGHEPSGVVAAVGGGVTHLKEGDEVTVEPAKPCLKCRLCLNGRYNLCRDVIAVPLDMPGAFAEYLLFDASFVYKLPTGVNLQTGALTEPLAVALHALEQTGARPGRTAAVLGTGVIGLLCVMCLKAYGVIDIIAVDVLENRLLAARNAGASHTVNIKSSEVLDAVNEITGGSGVDIVIEASGNVDSVMNTPYLAAHAGTIVQVGAVSERVPIDYAELMRKEAVIRHSLKYCNNFNTALAMLKAGSVPADSIITHVFPFDRLNEALSFTMDHPEQCIKTLISF